MAKQEMCLSRIKLWQRAHVNDNTTEEIWSDLFSSLAYTAKQSSYKAYNIML